MDRAALTTKDPNPVGAATGVSPLIASSTGGAVATIKSLHTFYRTMRRTPENQLVRRRHAISPMLSRMPGRIPGLASLDRMLRTRLFVRDLQLLNDVLSTTVCSDRYWVWSGLLLGWAREGTVLRHDLLDADFAYAEEDEPLILEGIEALVNAGFRRGYSFRNNSGTLTEHTVIRHGAKFEFFCMSPVGARWLYHIYGSEHNEWFQFHLHLPRQPLEPFDFLGRTWAKSLDHDWELTYEYGDWRTPDPQWNFLESESIVGREEWTGG